MADKLQRGDWAPEVKSLDVKGEVFDMSEYTDFGIWLAFYRYASCPMCNQHFDDVCGQRQRLLDNDILFVAVFESESRFFSKNIVSREFSNIKLIPNPSKSLYDSYAVEQSWLKVFKPDVAVAGVKAVANGYMFDKVDGPVDRIPAHFLILPGGMVHQARYGKSAADHVKWRDLDDFFESVRATRSQIVRRQPEPPTVSNPNMLTMPKMEVPAEISLAVPEGATPRQSPPPPPGDETVDLDPTLVIPQKKKP